MSYFKKDKSELLALERAEKIVSALYLVTSLLGEKEPIKNKLREEGLTLLSLCLENTQVSEKDKGCIASGLVASLERVQSLLFVSKASGTISFMNADLLMRGFLSLKQFFEARESALFEGLNVPHALIDIESVQSVSLGELGHKENEGEGERSQEGSSFAKAGGRESVFLTQKINAVSGGEGRVAAIDKESKASDIPKVWMNRTVSEAPRGVFKARKVSRREQILGVFVRGRDISIKDISAKVKGCSEKTIQRELNTLVYDHLLERIGEKRWSRYVLR
jgi:hypothetical protein